MRACVRACVHHSQCPLWCGPPSLPRASARDTFTTRKDKAAAAIEKLTEELATLADELATMAKQQAAMDEMRGEQKATFAEAKKDFEDGIEGLTMALQILRDYYADKEESLMQADQPATSVHSKASGAATGIIGMLEVAQSDFSKMLADATVEEESAIKEYEKITQENQAYPNNVNHCGYPHVFRSDRDI